MHGPRDLESLLDEALRLPPDARPAFLDSRCGDDAEIRSAIEELLRESDERHPILKPGGVFDGPLWEELLGEPDELTVGVRLGPYEVRGTIGAGGMGEVYRAHDTRLSRDVAIKVLPAAAGSVDALARFEREARAVAALSHPNILAIHDVGADGSTHFVVTELLEGETLRARLAARGSLAPAEAVSYGAQIARGLGAAHDRGIIHRDLKPENIFITRDGRIKILDFGIAIFDQASMPTGEHPGLTRTGQLVGTVGYMAPEQLLGQSATPQSDLFALGVVMHEMLAGAHPFERKTAPEMQTAVLREDPASLSRAAPGVPPSLVRVIERCLEKQSSLRPESARDLAMFLEALRDAEAPAAKPVEDEPARRLRLRLVAASLGFLLLAVSAWGYIGIVTRRAAQEIVASELMRADRMTRYIHNEQRTRIGLVATSFASFPELKAVFATDFATIRDFLLQYQQRMPGQPLLVALAPDGTVLARSDDPAPPAATQPNEWLSVLLAAPGEASVVDIGNRPSVAVAVALEAAGTVFGYLVAAEAIDQRFAQSISEVTADGVVLLSENAVLGTTLRSGQNPWRSLAAWRTSGGRADGIIETTIGAQSYFAHEVPLASRPGVSAVILREREEAFGPYRRGQRTLMLVALVIAAATLSSALWAPRLVRRHATPTRNVPAQRG